MSTGGQTPNQPNPSEIQIESPQPPSQLQELQWQPVPLQNFSNMLRRDFLAVSMDKLIVLFSKIVSGKIKLSILDPENKTHHLVEAPTDPLSHLDDIVGCSWEGNKIIVMGHQTTKLPKTFILKIYEVQVYLGIITFFKTSDGFTAEHQAIPQTVIQASSFIPPNYTLATMKSMLHVTSRGDNNMKPEMPLRVYSFDLETLKPASSPQTIAEANIKSHTSFVHEDDLHVYFKAEATSSHPEKAACIKLDSSRTIISTALSPDNLLCSPDFQYQVVNRRVYGFANSPDKADYSTLHIYDIDGDNWETCKAKGEDLDLQNKRLMTLVGNKIYMISRTEGILCLDLSDLATVEKQKPKANLQTMEPLDKDALAKMFFKQAPYSDVIFEVESQVIPAHRWWLIKRSKYFANMFSSGMIEAKSERIVIYDMKATTFRAFLEFLYTDHVQLTETRALELFEQADKYSVPALTKLCEEYLCACINPDNYVKIAQLAEMLDAPTLRKATVLYISKNAKRLKDRKDFADISDQMLRDVILMITI